MECANMGPSIKWILPGICLATGVMSNCNNHGENSENAWKIEGSSHFLKQVHYETVFFTITNVVDDKYIYKFLVKL